MSTTMTQVRQDAANITTVQDLAARLVEMEERKRDYIVDTRRMSFTTNERTDDGEWLSHLTFDADGGIVSGVVNEHAHNQIAARLEIPRRYYDRMRTDAVSLLDENVGHWLREKPEKRMIRMLDDRVRAVMSNRYKRRDNYQLMRDAILPVFSGPAGHLFSFQVASLTPERLVLRALHTTLTQEVAVGDVVQAGVQIRNSEVGKGSLEITPFVWRLRCLNGLVVEDGRMRAYHISGVQEADENSRIFQDDTIAADDHAFMLKARDAIAAAVDESIFGEAVERMRQAADPSTAVSNPVAATEKLAQTFDLSDGERDGILGYLASGGDLSLWGMVNAVTATAKAAGSFDRQEEMERLGGRMLEMPRKQWEPIALAR